MIITKLKPGFEQCTLKFITLFDPLLVLFVSYARRLTNMYPSEINKYFSTNNHSADSDRANNNSLIAHIASLPGFDSSKARIVQHYSSQGSSPEKLLSPDIGPTAAELILPWRRDRSYQSFGMFVQAYCFTLFRWDTLNATFAYIQREFNGILCLIVTVAVDRTLIARQKITCNAFVIFFPYFSFLEMRLNCFTRKSSVVSLPQLLFYY